jgi:hypothetical protein
VNKRQLADARRGVRLLTGYLRGSGERLDKYLEDQDADAYVACADPLVTVAVILVRQVRVLTEGLTEKALDACLAELDAESRGHVNYFSL